MNNKFGVEFLLAFKKIVISFLNVTESHITKKSITYILKYMESKWQLQYDKH